MDCKETRERLAQYIDQELGDQELDGVREHLDGCPACRQEYDQHGALDMLLKSCFTLEPPAERMDDFWPSLAEQLDGTGSSAGGGGSVGNGKDEILFSSSSAMQILKIPDPKVAAVAEAPVAAAAPTEAPQQAQSPWRWPVALIASTVIIVVGLLVYQNRQVQLHGPTGAGAGIAAAPSEDHMSPGGPAPTAVALAPAAGEERGEPQPGSAPEPPAEPAPSDDPAAAPAGEPKPGQEADKAPAPGAAKHAKRKGAARKRKGGRKASAARGSVAAKASPAKPSPAAKSKAKPAKKRKAGKGDDLLDSLINSALGDNDKPKKGAGKKAEKKKPAVNMDLPEQLSMNQIRGAMNRVKGLVQSCYDQFQVEGRANVQMLITPDGKPTKLRVKGKFFGSDTGTCVLKAAKKAKFPKFRGKPMTIKYPFLLQ